jgi:hypothetical protein
MRFFKFREKKFLTFYLLLLLFAFWGLLCYAQEQKYYVLFSNNAGEPAKLVRHENVDFQGTKTSFKFRTYGTKAYSTKAARLFSKQVVEELVATSTVSVVDQWEQRISISKMLDSEAEEYKNRLVTVGSGSLRLFK